MAVLRLDEIIRGSGRYTRREVIGLVNAGRVTVDGAAAAAISQRCDTTADVRVDGIPVVMEPPVCLMLHKPAGYVTATVSGREPPVTDLLPPELRHLFPVGRLDLDAEGLLLLTNDGGLNHRLTAPRHGVRKTYYAEHEGTASADDVAAFRAGLTLRDGTVCLPAELRPLGEGKSEITVQEGKYHQVRRMMASRGMTVTYLRRETEGGLTLAGLSCGEVRELTEAELAVLEP